MRRANSNIWLLDAGIALLGLLVIVLVLRLFRFDDSRFFYNAWTYCLAIPTVLIFSSMLAHVMIPKHAERSIQTGFLLSVLVHLGLTVAAINTVLFSGLLQEGSKEMVQKLRSMSQGTSFEPPASATNDSEPDYLRPVQNQIDPSSPVQLRPESEPQKALELLDSPNQSSVDTNKQIDDEQLAQVQMLEPELSAHEAALPQRPEPFDVPIPREAISAPVAEQTPLAQDSLPDAKPLSIDRTVGQSGSRLELPTAASSIIPSAEPSAEPRAVDNQAAQQYLIERELSRPMQVANTPIQTAPTPESREQRLASMPKSPSKVPLENQPTNAPSRSSSNPEGDALASIGDLLGQRSELTRRNQASSVTASNAGGRIEYKDPLAGRIAASNSMRSSADLPSISDGGTAVPDLDRFRPASSPNQQNAKGLVPIPAPAFQQRVRRMDESNYQELKAMGPLGPKTEESIERGLEFLAKHQRSDGSWRLEDFGQRTVLRSDTAATALSLLSFQGAGYSHVQYKYQNECRKSLEFLVAGQQSNGDLYRPMDEASDRNGWLYSHAIATLALCEAYGMTQDENLQRPAQRAVDFLVYSQDRQEGGWRYEPRIGSDTSVTGWGMMALKSAELAGLYVPRQTFEGIQKWLDHSQASARERYLYRYNWLANTPETKHGAVPTPVMTSVGLLMRLYTGWKRDNAAMAQGADWLLKRPPAMGTEQAPRRDTYYWYYATQVLFHMGGTRWKSWYESLYPMLIETQQTQGPYAGSWEPLGTIPDAWGEYAGRLYVTTMNLLSLEVTYRHLPIYEATSR
jgi:hypothetical protein